MGEIGGRGAGGAVDFEGYCRAIGHSLEGEIIVVGRDVPTLDM